MSQWLRAQTPEPHPSLPVPLPPNIYSSASGRQKDFSLNWALPLMMSTPLGSAQPQLYMTALT